MKKNIIITIVICFFLLFTNFFVNTKAVNNHQRTSIISTLNDLEWIVGHFWEYETNLVFNLSVILNFGIYVEAEANNLIIIVNQVNEYKNEYILKIIGEANGIINVNGARFGSVQKVSGYANFEKDTYAIKSFSINISGLAAHNLIPFDFYYTIDFNPSFNYLNLPINEQEDYWKVDSIASIELGGKALGGIFPYEEIKDEEISTTIKLKNAEEITIPAGNFFAYKLEGDQGEQSEIWYAPNARNIVKIIEIFPLTITLFDEFGVAIKGDLTTEYNMTLINTNYDPENQPPNIPDRPKGVNEGKPGEEYIYSATTIDSDGDQLYYMFDWGDGSYSDWIGPIDSGEICEEKHIWSKKGNYQIKVKAKDVHECESYWSESLPITMPKKVLSQNMNLIQVLKNINYVFFQYLNNIMINKSFF